MNHSSVQRTTQNLLLEYCYSRNIFELKSTIDFKMVTLQDFNLGCSFLELKSKCFLQWTGVKVS